MKATTKTLGREATSARVDCLDESMFPCYSDASLAFR